MNKLFFIWTSRKKKKTVFGSIQNNGKLKKKKRKSNMAETMISTELGMNQRNQRKVSKKVELHFSDFALLVTLDCFRDVSQIW